MTKFSTNTNPNWPLVVGFLMCFLSETSAALCCSFKAASFVIPDSQFSLRFSYSRVHQCSWKPGQKSWKQLSWWSCHNNCCLLPSSLVIQFLIEVQSISSEYWLISSQGIWTWCISNWRKFIHLVGSEIFRKVLHYIITIQYPLYTYIFW